VSIEDKKRKLIEKELQNLGITDKEQIESLVDSLDTFARLIIDMYKASKLNKQ
jgi:hypothetical protein